VRRIGFLVPVVVASVGLVDQQPVLSADSLDDLHDSADRVKWSLQLSPDEFASLEQALDVLVGDDARRLERAVETLESAARPLPPPVRLAAESRILAPVEGMSYERLVTAAVDKTQDKRAGLLGDLRVEKVAVIASKRHLQTIEVVKATYWSSVASGERGVDFTIRNGSDEPISALVLDCRLIDTTRRQTRERGTCRAEFGAALPPGLSAAVTAPVSWEARQRLGWTVEARAIRAYGTSGDPLWEIPSELDRREAGRLAAIESSLADVDHDLEALRAAGVAVR
jgi:hypothetical protein